MSDEQNNTSTPVAEPASKTRPKVQPPYHVLIENDDFHTQDFVVGVLQKVFGYATEKCVELMFHAHTNGEAVVWTGSKEVAELKLEQILTYHQNHYIDGRPLGPLGCRIEPAI